MTSLDLIASPAPPSPRRFCIAALAAGLFFAGWSFYIAPPAIPQFDHDCAEACNSLLQAHSKSRGILVFFTDLGSIAALLVMAVMGALWQNSLNRRFLALAWLGVVLGGGLLNFGLKTAFDRPRPPVELRDRAVLENNASYPSGHSMGSAIGYGMLAYVLLLTQRCRGCRIATVLLVAGVVIAIGCSRFMLRAHWLSDVIAGWAIGLAWLCFCLALVERRRARFPLAV